MRRTRDKKNGGGHVHRKFPIRKWDYAYKSEGFREGVATVAALTPFAPGTPAAGSDVWHGVRLFVLTTIDDLSRFLIFATFDFWLSLWIRRWWKMEFRAILETGQLQHSSRCGNCGEFALIGTLAWWISRLNECTHENCNNVGHKGLRRNSRFSLFLEYWEKEERELEFGSNYSPLYNNYISISTYHAILYWIFFFCAELPWRFCLKKARGICFVFAYWKDFTTTFIRGDDFHTVKKIYTGDHRNNKL